MEEKNVTRIEYFDSKPQFAHIETDVEINDWIEGSIQSAFPSKITKVRINESKYQSVHEDIEPKIYSHLEYLKEKKLIQEKETYNLFNAKTDGWTSYYGEPLVSIPKFKPIIDLFQESIYRTFNFFHGNNDYLIGMESCWFTVYEEGQYVPSHTHPGSFISGVYYFKAEENCGDIVFKDPIGCMKDMMINPSPMKVMNSYSVLAIKPTTGMMLLFPSWMPHETKPNLSGEDRIIFSFNLHLHPKSKINFRY